MKSQYSVELINLLKNVAVKRGEFRLRSGEISDYYIDVRQASLSGEGSIILSEAILDCIPQGVKTIGGLELGSASIVGSVISYSYLLDYLSGDINGFIVRKNQKSYGTGQRIENCPQSGTRVILIEDATTTGLSLLSAIQAVEAEGLEVVLALA